MPLISHPLDKDLFFPYVKDDLDAPEKMIKSLIDEYLKGEIGRASCRERVSSPV